MTNFNRGVWVIGAGGIGSAFAKKCRQENIDVKLISRPDYDMTKKDDVDRFIDSIEQLPSVIVNTIGTLYDDHHSPEKSLSSFTEEWFYDSLRINALPVMWIAHALSKKLTKRDELVFITISARVSSISDNHLGGWYSYRASKCVLNMFIKNISIEWSRRFPKVAICGYHPGTVDTHLSKPFQKNMNPEKIFSPERAADYLFIQVQKTTPIMSGDLFDWQGKRIKF